MSGLRRRLVAVGLALFGAGWARADTVTFDFSGNAGVLPSLTVPGSQPFYSATATGKTYAATLSSTTQGQAVFTNTPSYASGTLAKIYQLDLGLGVDSDTLTTLETGTDNRRINSYMNYAEVLWVEINPQIGYAITSAKLINVSDGEVGGLLDVNGNPLNFTASADGLNLTFTPPANSYIFGVYESNRGFQPSAPGIKLSQFEITLSPSSQSPVPLPTTVWAGGILIGCVAVKRRRGGAPALL